MKLIGSLYKRIVQISPGIEVALRKLYWNNTSLFAKFSPYRITNNPTSPTPVNFDEIIQYLKSKGVGKGSLLVVHSSYGALECTGLTPDEIIDQLLALIGPDGTLAMPAMRKYKEPTGAALLTTPTDDLVCTYNVKKTMVKTGLLPYTLMHREGSVTSHHPFDTMTALGPLAAAMMEHNLDGEYPVSHGPGSSWKFCMDHDAVVISLGVDLLHYNSIAHVAEESYGDWHWTDKEWYRLRKFILIDEKKVSSEIVVRQRKPEWGMIYNAGLFFEKKFPVTYLDQKVFGGGLRVDFERAKECIEFIRDCQKKYPGYPYYKKR